MHFKTGAVLATLSLAAAGCGSTGGGSTPDVSGGQTSDQATLFRAANLSKVLDQVKSKLGSGYQGAVLKIEPKDIKLIAQGSAGTQIVTVDNQGKAVTVNAPGGGQPTFDLSAVDPNAAQRAVDAVRSKAHVGLSDIAYLTFTSDPINHQVRWGVYLRSGGYYAASANGGHVVSHANTGGAGAPGGAGVPSGGGASPTPSAGAGAGSGQDTATCIQNAGTDVNKIKKCTGQ